MNVELQQQNEAALLELGCSIHGMSFTGHEVTIQTKDRVIAISIDGELVLHHETTDLPLLQANLRCVLEPYFSEIADGVQKHMTGEGEEA